MKIHFIGIGSIGVSALAQYYLSENHEISGSDLCTSETTDFLKEKHIKIIKRHEEKNIKKNMDLVIYSPAVKKDNPELKRAKELNIKTKSYPEALGEITKEYFTIAISGTHGKSTITSILGITLTETKIDPTVIIGTKLKEFGGTNFRKGKSKYLLIEADEWNASFLNYHPNIILLNNIEEEHLDYYKNLKHMIGIFKKYISLLPKDGTIIANKDDENVKELTEDYIKTSPGSCARKVVYFSKNQFKDLKEIKTNIKIPGGHNALNALGAMHVAMEIGVSKKEFLKALPKYKGSWRRFEKIKENPTVISDYGHHPTEVLKTMEAAREKYPKNQITLIFQPHQHQRTYYLFDKFIENLRKITDKNLADKIIITDIFDVAGREKKKTSNKVTAKKLVKEINREKVLYTKKENLLKNIKETKKNEVIIIMGAGDIYKICDEL